jgi:site-specific recombinase XerD
MNDLALQLLENEPLDVALLIPFHCHKPDMEHPVNLYLARLSPGSHRSTLSALHEIAKILTAGRYDAFQIDWSTLRYEHTLNLSSILRNRPVPGRPDTTYAPATINKYLAALRGCLRECFRLGYLNAETYHRAIDVPTAQGTSILKGRALSDVEMASLFAICPGESLQQIRDRALLAILYGGGLRRSEMVCLKVEDYDLATGHLKILKAKRDKERMSYLQGGIKQAVDVWVDVRGDSPGPLFYSVKAHKVVIRYDHNGTPLPMTPHAVLKILQRLAKQAKVTSFSPHDLRRTFISHLLDKKVDLATVQGMAGHANIGTTARYDRRGERAKIAASALVDIPLAVE